MPSLILLAAILAINTGVLMPSSIAFASQFPRVFSQGLMTGQGLSGIVAGFMRMATQAIWPHSLRTGATVFFCVSAASVLLTLILYRMLLHSDFTQASLHHEWLLDAKTGTKPFQPGSGGDFGRAPLLPPSTAPSPQASPTDDCHADKSFQLQKHAGQQSAHLEKSSLNGDPQVPTEGVHVLSDEGVDVFIPSDLDIPHDEFRYITEVFKMTWRACAGIWLCYFLTFLVYPATLSSIPYKGGLSIPFLATSGNWQVALLMIFNVFDTAGRFLPGYFQLLSYRTTLFAGAGRAVFVAFILWAAQGWGGGIPDAAMLSVLALFSVSNGYTTTSVMMLGPREVGLADREAAGGLLTFCLLFGMFCGTMASLALR